MIYVGIDIAKQTHYASVMNSDGEILAESIPFTNDHAGFQKLLSCTIYPMWNLSSLNFRISLSPGSIQSPVMRF